MKEVLTPQAFAQYVTPQGQLTTEGQILLLSLAEALREAQATIADHEARIAALEP